jgi:hypothetical protein
MQHASSFISIGFMGMTGGGQDSDCGMSAVGGKRGYFYKYLFLFIIL